MNRNTIPEDKGSYSIYDVVRNGVTATLRDLLGNMTTDSDDSQNVSQKAAVLYQACLCNKNDTTEAILKIMNASGLGDWPVLSEETSYANWTDVLLATGLYPILEINVGRNSKNISAHIIKIDQVTFPTVSDSFLVEPNTSDNQPVIEAYKKLIEAAVKIVKPNISEQEISKLADELVQFEGELANLTLPVEEEWEYEETEDETSEETEVVPEYFGDVAQDYEDVDELVNYQRTTIGILQRNFTGFPLLSLLKKEFTGLNVTLTEHEPVDIYITRYHEMMTFFNASNLKSRAESAEQSSRWD